MIFSYHVFFPLWNLELNNFHSLNLNVTHAMLIFNVTMK